MADTIQLDRCKASFIRDDLVLLTSMLRQRNANILADVCEDHAYHLTELLNKEK